MKTTITSKNMNISNGINDRIMKKAAKMERYLDPNVEMFVHLNNNKQNRKTCEITVPFEGIIIRAEASHDDNLYICIDQSLAKIERQIHKHRSKLGKRLRGDAFKVVDLEYIPELSIIEEEIGWEVVKTKTLPVRPMSIEDAALQMELLGHDFFAFVNIETDRTNVLYLRKDGNLGLLEPEV